MKKKFFHNSLTFREDCRAQGSAQFAQQLSLSLDTPQAPEVFFFKKRQNPQISCIPGISLTSHRKYRVMAGDKILGDHLTLDEARDLANGGGR